MLKILLRLFSVALIVLIAVGYMASRSMSVQSVGSVSIELEGKKAAVLEPTVEKIDTEKYLITVNGESIYVGKNEPTFTPEITMYRYGDEAFLSLYEPLINELPLNQKNSSSGLDGTIITWASKDIQFKFYPLDISGTFAKERTYGFEYEIVIANSKAGTDALLSNIKFPLESQGLVFYYQPPLTERFSPGWSGEFQTIIEVTETQVTDASTGEVFVERPENIVGSYAAKYGLSGDYTLLGGKNYFTGKAFHIYRPHLTDSAGSQTWANIIIDNTEMVLDFSGIADWLNKAKYPVVIDPTFGYETIGGTSLTGADDYIVGYRDTCPEAGTADSISFYLPTSAYDDGPRRLAIYLDSDKSYIEETGAYSGETPDAWVSHDLLSNPVLSNVDYWLCHYAEELAMKYDDGGSSDFGYVTHAYPGSWPDPITWSYVDRLLSIYCTYTAAATPNISNTPSAWSVNAGVPITTSTDYWANGSEPAWPLGDVDCEFAVTNNSGAAVDIDIKATNFTGGVGWTLAGAAGENLVVLKAGVSGAANEGAFVTLTTTDQAFITSLGDTATEYWELMMESATSHTDGVAKSSTLTLTASIS